jgi:cellulose synthase/poly-beta-1,6-N-acetylglucosamine synthase-like glycosyltransferase
MPLTILYTAWIIFQTIIGFVLVFPVISWLVYLLVKKNPVTKNDLPKTEADYGIIVTAYKDISNIPNVVQSLLKLDYTNYVIYVIADNCPRLEKDFNDDRVVILYPDPVLENQIKSHFYAIENFKRPHDRLTIIDSDNLVEPDYLTALNSSFDAGYEAVQGIRTAKNFDTAYACLDAANEIYYLFYDRKILFAIGSSSMLSGSGMAFTVRLYKECLGHLLEIAGAGFDKLLQKEILSRGNRIAFANEAIVYDEKTSSADQLVKQRARWNNTWFRYFKFGLGLLLKGISRFNLNQTLAGFTLVRPPLFILLIVCAMILLANVFISFTAVLVWAGLLLLFSIGFFIALTSSKTDKRIYQALVHIPKFIFLQVLSLLKVRRANQHSVATIHHYNKEIEEIKE